MLDKLVSLRCPECKEKIKEEDSLCPFCGLDLDEPLNVLESQIIAEEYFDEAMKTCNSGKSLKHALIDIDLSIQFDPTSAEAHNLRGIILDLMEEKDAAILSYEEAIRINPNYSDAVNNLKEIKDEQLSGETRSLGGFFHREDNFMEETNAVTLSYQEAIRADLSYSDAVDNLRETKGERPVKKTREFDSFSYQEDGFGLRFFKNIKWIVVLIAVLWALNFGYQEYGRDFILPKNTIVFQPDYSQVNNVTSEDLSGCRKVSKKQHLCGNRLFRGKLLYP